MSLHLNRESRTETLRQYRPFWTTSDKRVLYIRPKTDVLFVRFGPDFRSGMSQSVFHSVYSDIPWDPVTRWLSSPQKKYLKAIFTAKYVRLLDWHDPKHEQEVFGRRYSMMAERYLRSLWKWNCKLHCDSESPDEFEDFDDEGYAY